MKISKLTVTGQGIWPDLRLENLDRRMNVFFAPSRSGKSTIAQLAGHLLYGKFPLRASSDLLPFDQRVLPLGHSPSQETSPVHPDQSPADGQVPVPGTVQVESEGGQFTLKRQPTPGQSCRLTISANDGQTVDEQTIPSLLSHLPPTLLSRLYAIDFTQTPQIDWFLDEAISRQLQGITGEGSKKTSLPGQKVDGRHDQPKLGKLTSPDCHETLDRLVCRRDDLARQLAEQLSARRQESGARQSELDKIETALTGHREQADDLQTQLRGIETRLTEIEIRLRYFSLERIARQTPPAGRSQLRGNCPISGESQISGESSHKPISSHHHLLAELDAEISRCRHTLRDLKARSTTLHSEWVQLQPDGTADRVTSLTDGRATLGVLEHLVDDLDAEISQLARAHQAVQSAGHDAHARLSPVAEIIRQQIYTLCGQLAEQERAVRRQQIETERRQLSRVQTDLGEQLEQLLFRRESLVRASQSARQPGLRLPQAPVPEYCQCEQHGPFLHHANAMILARTDRADPEADAEAQQRQFEEKRNMLRTALEKHESEIDLLQSRWQQMQHDRATLLDTPTLNSVRAELQKLEHEISLEFNPAQADATISNLARESQPDRAPQPQPAAARAQGDGKAWRASDILAQLTNGRLTQIRLQQRKYSNPLPPAGHSNFEWTLLDHEGQQRTPDSLDETELDQLTLSLLLALVAAHARHGIDLPLLLDEPFLRQDRAAAAAMAGLLHQFANDGQQILVFTENQYALRRFQSLRSPIHFIDSIRRQPLAPGNRDRDQGPTKRSRPAKNAPGSSVQQSAPAVPAKDSHPPLSARFYLEPESPVEEAPSIGPKTADRLAKVGIHTVADLLHADPESTAGELEVSHINASTITAWQQQACLVCRIPQLRGFGAQLLVACELTEPEQLVDADSMAIVKKILAFCKSKQGQRILRGSDIPSRERIEGWIRNAAYTRSLEAA